MLTWISCMGFCTKKVENKSSDNIRIREEIIGDRLLYILQVYAPFLSEAMHKKWMPVAFFICASMHNAQKFDD